MPVGVSLSGPLGAKQGYRHHQGDAQLDLAAQDLQFGLVRICPRESLPAIREWRPRAVVAWILISIAALCLGWIDFSLIVIVLTVAMGAGLVLASSAHGIRWMRTGSLLMVLPFLAALMKFWRQPLRVPMENTQNR